MTHYTTELFRGVRDYRMPAEWLCGDIGKTRFLQSHVASGAAINNSKLRKPDLLDPAVEVALQRDRVSPRPNQGQILFLIVAPFTEVILRRCDGQRNQKQQADRAKSSNRMAEQRLPYGRRVLGG